MLYHGSKAGAFDLKTVVLESIVSMKRAGMMFAFTSEVCVCVSFLQEQILSSLTTPQVCLTGSWANRAARGMRSVQCSSTPFFAEF